MGAACSGQNETERKISVAMKRSTIRQVEGRKILLLGPGESGKSTIFKQAQFLYAEKFKNPSERAPHVIAIHGNIVSGIKNMLAIAETSETFLQPTNLEHAHVMLELSLSSAITPTIGNTIKALWTDPSMKRVYQSREKYHIGDNLAYFMTRIDEISNPNYVPSVNDIIQSRVRTSGIVEQEVHIERVLFKFVDVGGQRGERKKWIHCFDRSDVVMFVCAISEFNQVLQEDGKTNRVVESINLFKQVANLPNFRSAFFVLFLNKADLFDQKFPSAHEDLRKVFPNYPPGGLEINRAKEFLTQTWRDIWFQMWPEEREADEQSCRLMIHWTNATDPEVMQIAFEAVHKKVIKDNLIRNGLD